MIVTEDKHHLFQALKAEIPTYEIQNLKMFDFGTCPLPLNRDCTEGGAGGTSPPPLLFCKNKNKSNKKKLTKIMEPKIASHSKTYCGVPIKFLLPLPCLCLFLQTESTEWTPTVWNHSRCPPPSPSPPSPPKKYIYRERNIQLWRENIYLRVCTLGYGLSFVHFYLWPIMRCRP